MDLLVLNKQFDNIGIVDTYESFNWTDRYNEAGDFELVVLATSEMLDIIKTSRYLYLSLSEHLMIIESVLIGFDDERGRLIEASGRSLESLLDRRIVWNKYTVGANSLVKNVINSLVSRNFTSASGNSADRVISHFSVSVTNDSRLNTPTISEDVQYFGDNIYDLVSELCKLYKFGFKIVPNYSVSGQEGFVFSLYVGVDRSSTNQTVPPVIFSPYFENIVNTQYYRSVKTYKTIILVSGEDINPNTGEREGSGVKTVVVSASRGNKTGWDRRETYLAASDVSSKTEEGNYIGKASYEAMLKLRGKRELANDTNSIAETFDGEVDYQSSFIYGTDYKLGDIVEVADDFGHQSTARISEIIFSNDSEGFSINPSFTILDSEEIT